MTEVHAGARGLRSPGGRGFGPQLGVGGSVGGAAGLAWVGEQHLVDGRPHRFGG